MPTFEQVIWMVGRGKDQSQVVPFRCLEFLNDFGENGKKHSAIAVEFQLFLESGREQLFLFYSSCDDHQKIIWSWGAIFA